MASVEQLGIQGRKNWCAIVVVVAVCLLTVNVATRFASASSFSTHSVTVTVKDASARAQRQRLDKDAANWVTPISSPRPLQAPITVRCALPEGAPLPYLSVADALYNRPPPSA
jgi:hypothetical protein